MAEERVPQNDRPLSDEIDDEWISDGSESHQAVRRSNDIAIPDHLKVLLSGQAYAYCFVDAMWGT